MAPLRILIVTGTFHPEAGGPPRYLLNLATDLTRAGHAVSVVTFGEPFEHEYPFPVKRISRRWPVPVRLALMAFAVVPRAVTADLLYVNDYGLPPAIVNLSLRKPLVMKIVGDFAWEWSVRHGRVTENIDDFQLHSHSAEVTLLKGMQRFYTWRADRIITPSSYLKGIVSGWGIDAGKVRVVTNAIDPAKFSFPESREAAQKQLGLEGRFVVTVARLTPWKGVDALIRCVPRLPEGWKLLVVGDGPERARLEEQSRAAGLTQRVIFTGEVAQNTVPAYMRASDIFALYTGYEGLSHVLLEAQLAGLPSVATRKGGNPEVIRDGENGLLVEYGNEESLAAALARLSGDEALRTRLADNARRAAVEFDWSRLFEKTTAVFREAAFGENPPA
ncbi:MAG: glycosyltransferase family 4 protein [Planctomycetes bacterium]|nr:glycosyltransferase family 4 protein [Planctomycetota bacterium]